MPIRPIESKMATLTLMYKGLNGLPSPYLADDCKIDTA